MKHKLMSLIFVVVVSIFSCNIGTYPGVDQEVIAALKKKGMTAKKALGDSHEISLSRCHGGGADYCPSVLNGIRLLLGQFKHMRKRIAGMRLDAAAGQAAAQSMTLGETTSSIS